MKDYSRVTRGAIFWFNPNKAYGEDFRYLSSTGEALHSNVQGSNRPWVVVSNNIANCSSNTCNIVPLTTEEKADIPVHIKFFIGDKLQTALCEQVRTVDIGALGDYIGTVSEPIENKLSQALRLQFDIPLNSPSLEHRVLDLERVLQGLYKEEKEGENYVEE